MMKKTIFFIVLILTLNLIPLTFLHSARMTGVITTVKGEVHVLPYQKNIWQPSKVGTFLYEGYTVKTLKKSQAAITLTNGVVMKLNQNTEFSFDVTSSIEKVGSTIKMKAGQIYSSVRPKTKFEIHTPVAIVAVRGTEFDVNYGVGKLDLAVYKGNVNLKNKYGDVDVKEGESSSATGGNAPKPPKKMEEKKGEGWQEEVKIKGILKIETKIAKPVMDAPFEIAVSVYDADNKLDKTAKPEIMVKSDTSEMSFSSDGISFNSDIKISVAEGIYKLFAKTSASGVNSIIALSDGYTAGQLTITTTPAKTKNLKLKVKSSTGDDELLLKFKKK